MSTVRQEEPRPGSSLGRTALRALPRGVSVDRRGGRRKLRPRRSQITHPGVGGPLGALVRTVPDGQPNGGADGDSVRRPTESRQGQRRRGSRNGAPLPGDEHTHAACAQNRQDRRTDSRRTPSTAAADESLRCSRTLLAPRTDRARPGAARVTGLPFAVPATRRIRGIPPEVALDEADGMPEPCALSFDNVAAIPKAWMVERICRLSPERLHEVCRALSIAAGCGRTRCRIASDFYNAEQAAKDPRRGPLAWPARLVRRRRQLPALPALRRLLATPAGRAGCSKLTVPTGR